MNSQEDNEEWTIKNQGGAQNDTGPHALPRHGRRLGHVHNIGRLVAKRFGQTPVVPLVVYLRAGGNGLGEEEYRVTLFEREQLRFR